MRDFIERQISEIRVAIENLGGEFFNYTFEDPASVEEVRSIEQDLGRQLPEDLRDFALTVSRKITFGWTLPKGMEPPEPLDGIFGGGLKYDLASIPRLEEGRKSWQQECFPDPTDEYDRIWHDKLGFHHVMNGDVLAFDPSGKVVYLSHDDGEGHGWVMAPSFTELIRRWLPLGCPGPEDWQWLPFTSGPESGISPECDAAEQWLEFIGKAR